MWRNEKCHKGYGTDCRPCSSITLRFQCVSLLCNHSKWTGICSMISSLCCARVFFWVSARCSYKHIDLLSLMQNTGYWSTLASLFMFMLWWCVAGERAKASQRSSERRSLIAIMAILHLIFFFESTITWSIHAYGYREKQCETKHKYRHFLVCVLCECSMCSVWVCDRRELKREKVTPWKTKLIIFCHLRNGLYDFRSRDKGEK